MLVSAHRKIVSSSIKFMSAGIGFKLKQESSRDPEFMGPITPNKIIRILMGEGEISWSISRTQSCSQIFLMPFQMVHFNKIYLVKYTIYKEVLLWKNLAVKDRSEFYKRIKTRDMTHSRKNLELSTQNTVERWLERNRTITLYFGMAKSFAWKSWIKKLL